MFKPLNTPNAQTEEGVGLCFPPCFLFRVVRGCCCLFRIEFKDERHPRYWMAQAFPVLLVIRNAEGEVRWMKVRDCRLRDVIAKVPSVPTFPLVHPVHSLELADRACLHERVERTEGRAAGTGLHPTAATQSGRPCVSSS